MKRSLIRQSKLKHGVTLVSERIRGMQGVSMGVWVKTGTRSEPPELAGISHFLEHMLFKGTTTRSAHDLVREVEDVGGDFNAFTAREYTCFQILIPRRDVSIGIDILSDVLKNSKFDRKEIERERKVILQEIAMVEDSPEEFAWDLLYEKAFPNHGLGHPILGTPKTIRRMSRENLIQYFHHHYSPENMVIAVAGDVPHSLLKERFEKKLSGRKKTELRKSTPVRAPALNEVAHWAHRSTEQAQVLLGLEGFSANSRLRTPALLLSHHLGVGMSSVLFQKIREEEGLAYSVYTYLAPYWDTSLFTIYFATSSHKVARCVQITKQVLLELTKKRLSPKTLQSLKENILGNLQLAADDLEHRMASLAKYHIFKEKMATLKVVSREIQKVTAEDIQKAAQKLTLAHRRIAVGVGPRPSTAGLKMFRSWLVR